MLHSLHLASTADSLKHPGEHDYHVTAVHQERQSASVGLGRSVSYEHHVFSIQETAVACVLAAVLAGAFKWKASSSASLRSGL